MGKQTAATRAVPGHSLKAYGNPFTEKGEPASMYVSTGRAHCGCGARSGIMPDNACRRTWHREHLDAVSVELDAPGV